MIFLLFPFSILRLGGIKALSLFDQEQYSQSIFNIISMKTFITLCLIILMINTQPINFDYSAHGDDWGAISADCDPQSLKSKQQSPIDLSQDISNASQSFLFFNFYSAATTVSYLNTTVYLRSSSMGQIYTKSIKGDIIAMKATEGRIRSQSEHTIDGRRYDLELQIFFTEAIASTRNERLGLALLFEKSDTQSSKPLLDIKKSAPDGGSIKLDLSVLLNNAEPFDFWFYLGSGTIPPCIDAKLDWIVSKKIFKVGQEQYNFFYNLFNNEAMKGNYRNIQNRRDNTIDYYHFSSA